METVIDPTQLLEVCEGPDGESLDNHDHVSGGLISG